MNARLLFRTMLRQSRGARGRLLFFASCVAVGVSALVGVASLVSAIELGLRVRARELLGGDLALESRRPLPDVATYLPAAQKSAARIQLSLLPTMVHNDAGQSRLVEIKAVDLTHGSFPLAGELVLDPQKPLPELLDDESVLVAPEVMRTLHLKPGDTLHLGGLLLRVRGVIVREPDPLTFAITLGPRVLMTQATLARTDLLRFGNRVRYRTLLAFPRGISENALLDLKTQLERTFPGADSFVHVESRADAQPAMRGTLERVQHYLSLVALLSLLVASIGVAQIVSSWLAQAVPQTAILRCLGFRPHEVLIIYLTHVLLLALVGSVIGAGAGALLPFLAARLHPELVPPEALLHWPVADMARGIALGVFVALVFSLPPLTAVWRVSPARVLRQEAEPLPVPRAMRAFALGSVFLTVLMAAFIQSRDLVMASLFTLGAFGLAAMLALGARLLVSGIARLPRRRLPPVLWHGAAALTLPGARATSSIVALGMGTLVVLSIALIERALGQEIQTALPENAPSMFLLDIQPDQWPQVRSMAHDAAATHIDSVPVIMARLRSIDGRSVEQLAKERPGGDMRELERSHWVLTREQRVTTYRQLPPDNQVVAGKLWSDPKFPEISLEQGFARDLRVGIGSKVELDVQGVPIEFRVTSLRSVVWRSFAMNFFIVAEPGTLDDAPQFRLAGVRLSSAAEQAFQDRLARSHPNVTVLRVQSLLDRAADTLAQLAMAVQLLGAFAIATGFIILAGSVASAQLRRAREAALLKVLGLTRFSVLLLFALEHALSGAVAGAIGAAGAYTLSFVFLRRVLELTTTPSVLICLSAIVASSVLAVLGGVLASTRALLVRPLAVFRQHAE